MDQPVAAIIRRQIARAVMFDHVGLQRCDFVQLLFRDARTGQFAGGRLQRLADFKQLLDVLLRKFCGARSAVRQQHHKPFGGQHLEGLAQRRARYRQRSAQFALGNARARRNFALYQQVPEAGHHLVMHHRGISPESLASIHSECKIFA